MWSIIVEIVIPKVWPDRVEQVIRRDELFAPPGRIPTRAVIQEMARQRANEFIAMLHETMNVRPYDYGEPGAVRIRSVTWVPGQDLT